MSLPLLPSTAGRRPAAGGRYSAAPLAIVAATLAVLAAFAAPPAAAQNGPLSLTPPPAPVTGPVSKDPGMVPAEKALREKRYSDAIAAFDRVLATNPRNAQARFERAWALAQSGREDEAMRAFNEMAQDFPELPEPHNNLALMYAKRGDLKRAESELLLAIESRPDFAIAYTNLGDVYRRMAAEAYNNALRRNPGDARAAEGLRHVRESAAPVDADAAPASSPASSPAATAVPKSTSKSTSPRKSATGKSDNR
ncbi:tetratricopeptide repeat protein [Cupriavidus plantarum]|uniref:tetratricopeptide repeat protein n=1 Tax=Cupriavidus plantarum TaxID=942865 RepID=UPI000EB0E608|nr:tetratricopeptide repeat protein [Cupriavidus plantarum]RLK45717.1 tetratricopeptide repeat protein [Cupriavidus plantarum]